MKFLCLCHYDAAAFAQFTADDFQKMMEICAPHDKALKASGKVRMIGALGDPRVSKTFRGHAGSVRLGDGPYAETPHPIGAFFIVEADDIGQAVEIARLHPGTHLSHMAAGGIEVRRIENLEEL
jgi:hypothetical protein